MMIKGKKIKMLGKNTKTETLMLSHELTTVVIGCTNKDKKKKESDKKEKKIQT